MAESSQPQASMTTFPKAWCDQFGIPPRFYDAVPFDGAPTIPDSCFITGPIGCGKTHLAVAKIKQILLADRKIVNEYEKHGEFKNLIFISLPRLLLMLRKSFEKESRWSEEDIINIFSRCDWLILDDMGAEKMSDFARSSMNIIIDTRYNYKRNTIITSNLSLAEIGERFDDRIASRIVGMCEIVRLEGKDYRVK